MEFEYFIVGTAYPARVKLDDGKLNTSSLEFLDKTTRTWKPDTDVRMFLEEGIRVTEADATAFYDR